jgi:long-chain acyl-CoA synthetase
MRVIDMIRFWARTMPHRPAVIQAEMVTTYQGLDNAIESIGVHIDTMNLDKSEPVAVSIANPSFMIATTFALFRCGYSVALVNPTLFPYLRPAGIRNLVYDTQGQVLSGGRNIRFEPSWLPTAGLAGAKRPSPSRPVEVNVHAIFFTSGTTGLPKKIIQSGAALDQLLQYPFTCATGAHQKVLVMPGLSSTFGFNRVCELLNTGKTVCLAPFGESALWLIHVFGIEFVIASASQALTLTELKNKNPGYRLDSLHAVLIGGGKLGPLAIRRMRATLCKNLLSQYGSTEAGVIALAPFDLIENIPGAVGFLLPWTELEIVDEIGQILPLGAEGFIRYRTPQFIENLKIMESNKSDAKDEWFYPGDIGAINPQGVLHLTGRSADIINRGGHKVSATKIEEILEALPAIKEAAACAVMDQSDLEEIWIAIVAKGPIDIADIKRHLKEHTDIKIVPDEVFVVDQLPRGELGKIQKGRLKELLIARKMEAESHAPC